VLTPNYLVTLDPPVQTDSIALQPGQFFVIGSDNLPVLTQQWRDYGGEVNVSISDTVPGGISVTLKGPREEIPGVPGPYSLAISDGQTSYPAFSVTGMGVFTSPETLNLLTGADPDKTGQEVAQDIDNIFIGSKAQAYDRGAWACSVAAGPQIQFSVEVPSSALEEFGKTAGAISYVKESAYRVNNANVGNAATGLTFQSHVTTGDFDAAWSGYDTGDFDTFWTGNDTLDVKVKPLRLP
jgi:hypothetical protein